MPQEPSKSGHKRSNSTAPTSTDSPPALQGRHVRECACGRGLQCVGMTQAFRLLGDPRCHYVELPRYRKDPPAYKYVFRNKLREAYLKHLGISNANLDMGEFEAPKRRYVALHHFHPTVVQAFYENPLSSAQKHKVPISITEHEMKELAMSYDEDDRITSMTGKPTGGYYFVPNYSQGMVHQDLKTLIMAERKAKEYSARRRLAEKSKSKRPVPKDIDILKRGPRLSDAPGQIAIATKDHDDEDVKEELKAIPISIPTSESNKKREMELVVPNNGDQSKSFDDIWDEPDQQKPARQDSHSKSEKTRYTPTETSEGTPEEATEPATEKEVDFEKKEYVEKDPELELVTEPEMVTDIEKEEQSGKEGQPEAVKESEKDEEAKTEEEPEKIEAYEHTPAQAMSEKTPEDSETTRTVDVLIGHGVSRDETTTESPQTLQSVYYKGSQNAEFAVPLNNSQFSRKSCPVDLDDTIDGSTDDEEDDIAGETAEAPDEEAMVPNLIWEETEPFDRVHSFDDDEVGNSAKPSPWADEKINKDVSTGKIVESPDEEAVVPNHVSEKPGLVDLDVSFDDDEDSNSTKPSPWVNDKMNKDVSTGKTVESPDEEAVVPNHVSEKPGPVDLNVSFDNDEESNSTNPSPWANDKMNKDVSTGKIVESPDEEAVVPNHVSEKPGPAHLDHVIDEEEEDSPAKVKATEEEPVVTNQMLDPVDLGHVIDQGEEDTPSAARPSVNGEANPEASSLAKAEVAQGEVVPLNDEEDELEIDTSIIESETAFTPYSSRTTPAGMNVIDESDESDVDDNISQGSTGQLSLSADADPAGFVDSPGKRSSYFAKARVEFAGAKADADRAESDSPEKRPSYFAKAREEKEKEPEPPLEEERPPSPTVADEGNTFSLNHQLPGSDPTLRIQVHNDLIAWESKRRSQLSVQMEMNREKWTAARDVIRDGVDEVQVAERLVIGFAKAGRMFADALQAMYEDKFLDNQGQTVTNSFVQKRLMNQRQKMEYSIENTSKGSHDAGQGGQSSLLTSIIESQLVLASQFNDNSQHMEDEIFSEMIELREETLGRATELETLGDSILAEMKRSETELKKIWDVFDAMVTGDLMEYSMHGSMHGTMQSGSQHGGSFHSFGGGSLHGFATPRGEESPIVSSVNSPLVKSTFEQLGGVEDGWLIETYYRAGVAYQKSVFETGEKVLETVYQDIVSLEERRRDRLHQVMLAFIPRQRRLFLGLPAQLKEMLENLVGLRIDEDSLQALIDDSIKDRSRDHLKSQYQHKSSIMNRSRIQTSAADSNEVQNIEREFGNPFESSMILLSHVLELQPGGLRGMVNKEWRVTLAVVTAEGNFHLFHVPVATIGALTPFEAFKKLYPAMEFGTPGTWMQGRKEQIVKSLTPYMTLNLSKCTISISKLRQRQFDVMEEREKGAGNRFLNANAQRQKKCSLRLPSARETTEWVSLLEKTKKEVSQESPNVFKV